MLRIERVHHDPGMGETLQKTLFHYWYLNVYLEEVTSIETFDESFSLKCYGIWGGGANAFQRAKKMTHSTFEV